MVATLGAIAVLGVASGCGGGGDADPERGKELFVQRCGSCHVLADANTRGQIGPDLDDAFKQSVADGLGRDTIAGVVEKQIDLPTGNEMPADLVTGQDAVSVSEYVAQAVGKAPSGGSTGATGSQGGGGTARANGRGEVSIPADPSGQLAYEATEATAKPGRVTLLSKNDSPVPHDISVRGGGVDEQGNQVTGGDTSRVAVDLKAGEYEFYCSVPGHEQGGMKGTLTVR